MEFDEERAINAGSSNLVTEGGVYDAEIVDVTYNLKDNDVTFFEINFDSDGGLINYVKIYASNRDGSENYQINQIHALMGLLRVNKLKYERESEGRYKVHGLDGYKIKVAVQKEEFRKNDGEKGFSMKLLNFFDSETSQTYKERKEKLPAKKIERPIKDKLLVDTKQAETGNVNSDDSLDDDLPF